MGVLTWLFGQAGASDAVRFKSERELREAVMEAMKSNPAISEVRPADNDTSIESRIGDNKVLTDVGNLFDYLRTYPDEDPATWIDRLVQNAMELGSYQISADRLVPLVRTADTLAQDNADFLQERIAGDLVLTFAFENPGGYQYAGREELDSLNLRSARVTALDNLAAMLPRLSTEDDGGPVVLYSIDESFGLAPSLLLLDGFWEHVRPRFPAGAFVINPRRDQIFLIDKRDPAAKDYARRLVEATFQDDFALQSRGIFDRVDGKLVLLQYH